MKKEQGQVVILLLLIMVVALAIGLSTIGRSILEVSTSRKSEDSSRAFSAAEAGIERALKQNENNLGGTIINVGNITLQSNQAGAAVSGYSIPSTNLALNYSAVTKRDFAQFWLADPVNISNSSYVQPGFDIYFGDPDTCKYTTSGGCTGNTEDQPAIEVGVTYWDNTDKKYKILKRFYDSKMSSLGMTQERSGFSTCTDQLGRVGNTITSIDVINNDGSLGSVPTTYYCKVRVSYSTIITGSSFPVIVRVRLLYTNISHPIALKPDIGYSLPKQANIFQSSGSSGEVKRTLEVMNYRSVMPQYFDYVLFSAKTLSKNP